MIQVYFIEDPNDPDWKIVRHIEPRARRVTAERDDEVLSAPGHPVSSHNARLPDEAVIANGPPPGVPVLEVDVEHVMAYEEPDEETAYDDEEMPTDNEAEDAGGDGDNQETQADEDEAPLMDDM